MSSEPVFLPAQHIATMTSLEVVEFVNAVRAEKAQADKEEFPCKKYPRLHHKDFLRKVPKVLGEKHSAQFYAQYTDASGRANKCFNFPRREACLMSMSYDYEAQARVFDRMNELEGLVNISLLSDLEFHRYSNEEHQHRLVKMEEKSFREHGQKGSKLMTLRKREKKQISDYQAEVLKLSQMELPGFDLAIEAF